jgi:branched-chain amino acid transport system substrate-binding protein
MKKVIIWVVLVVVVVGLLVVFGGNRYKDDKVFRIGSTESLTGPSAYYGESTKKGIDLAFQEAKDKYSNVNFEIFHADNQFNAKVGVDAYRQLKTEHNIQAIITHTSPASVATLPIAKADGIVQIANSAAAESYSTPDDLSFRTTVGTDKEAKAMADYIDKKCNGSVGILGMNNEIGASISNSMRKEMNNRGIQIKFDEMFSLDTVDFRNQISKLKQIENLQCVFLPALSSHMVTFLKQSDELQYHPIVMSFRTMDDPTLIKNAGNLTNGLLYTTTLDLNSKTKEIEEFTSSYEKKYNETPNTYSAEGYLSAKLIIDSFVKCGDDSKCISDYLYSIKDYPSVFGPISFDRNGDVSYNYFVVEIRNGEKFNATE